MTNHSDDPVPRAYRLAMRVCAPVIRWWGRLEVAGLEHLPATGPVLLAANHDSHWDPVAIGIAGLPVRPIRALAKASLWDIPVLRRILDGMLQIPIQRGAADGGALGRAETELRAGACIGIFPEGTVSRGRELRARSGFGRLAHAVPESTIVSAVVRGTSDLPRFPRRPRISVRFFPPAGGDVRKNETAAELPTRLVAEIREQAPVPPARRALAPHD